MSKTFSHYINLRDDQNHQLVYTSQVYGTFFSVYAKFNLDPNQSTYSNQVSGKSVFYVESIDFEVINYKGLINIGLVDVILPSHYMNEVNQTLTEENQDTIKVFNLVMRGMGGLNERGSINGIPKTSLKKELGMEITSDDLMYFKRTLKRLHHDDREVGNGIFDEEFYYREGIPPFEAREEIIPDEVMPNLATIKFRSTSGPMCPENKLWVI